MSGAQRTATAACSAPPLCSLLAAIARITCGSPSPCFNPSLSSCCSSLQAVQQAVNAAFADGSLAEKLRALGLDLSDVAFVSGTNVNPTPPPPPSDDGGSSLSGGAIAGIAIGGVAAVLAGALPPACLFCGAVAQRSSSLLCCTPRLLRRLQNNYHPLLVALLLLNRCWSDCVRQQEAEGQPAGAQGQAGARAVLRAAAQCWFE